MKTIKICCTVHPYHCPKCKSLYYTEVECKCDKDHSQQPGEFANIQGGGGHTGRASALSPGLDSGGTESNTPSADIPIKIENKVKTQIITCHCCLEEKEEYVPGMCKTCSDKMDTHLIKFADSNKSNKWNCSI